MFYRPSPASPTSSEDSDEADRSPSPPTTPTDHGSYYRANPATTSTTTTPPPPPLVAPMVYRPSSSQHPTANDNQNAMRWSYQTRWYTAPSATSAAVERPCGSVMMPANTSNTHAVAPQTSTDPYFYRFVQSDARNSISSSIQIK